MEMFLIQPCLATALWISLAMGAPRLTMPNIALLNSNMTIKCEDSSSFMFLSLFTDVDTSAKTPIFPAADQIASNLGLLKEYEAGPKMTDLGKRVSVPSLYEAKLLTVNYARVTCADTNRYMCQMITYRDDVTLSSVERLTVIEPSDKPSFGKIVKCGTKECKRCKYYDESANVINVDTKFKLLCSSAMTFATGVTNTFHWYMMNVNGAWTEFGRGVKGRSPTSKTTHPYKKNKCLDKETKSTELTYTPLKTDPEKMMIKCSVKFRFRNTRAIILSKITTLCVYGGSPVSFTTSKPGGTPTQGGGGGVTVSTSAGSGGSGNPGDDGNPDGSVDTGGSGNPGDGDKPDGDGDTGGSDKPGDDGNPDGSGDSGGRGKPGDGGNPDGSGDSGGRDKPGDGGNPDGSGDPDSSGQTDGNSSLAKTLGGIGGAVVLLLLIFMFVRYVRYKRKKEEIEMGLREGDLEIKEEDIETGGRDPQRVASIIVAGSRISLNKIVSLTNTKQSGSRSNLSQRQSDMDTRTEDKTSRRKSRRSQRRKSKDRAPEDSYTDVGSSKRRKSRSRARDDDDVTDVQSTKRSRRSRRSRRGHD